MRFSLIPLWFTLAFCQCLISSPASAHPVGQEMTDAAVNLLASLSPEQKARAVFEFESEERFNWHFIPRPRKGLALRDLSVTQQQLAYLLIESPMSHRGYFKAVTIMTLDEVLYEMENHAPRREPGQYYLSIFGTPGKEPWGWRIEGHHLSLNFTVGPDSIGTTPSFFGANPAEVRQGPRKGLRVLRQEEELARAFVQSLTDQQRAVAIVASNAPQDIITGTNRQIMELKPVGIAASDLTREQRDALMNLLREYVQRYRESLADAEWKKIEQADPGRLHFAWAGGTGPQDKHYYRIQGPTFLMEYDKTQDNANHIHTVWRDLQNDFGGDLLKKHYAEVPHGN